MARIVNVAAAQLGPVHRADTRESVVKRLIAMLREAHAAGRPVVVRATSAEEVKAALARPEVAAALVTDRLLLELDLTELTYG